MNFDLPTITKFTDSDDEEDVLFIDKHDHADRGKTTSVGLSLIIPYVYIARRQTFHSIPRLQLRATLIRGTSPLARQRRRDIHSIQSRFRRSRSTFLCACALGLAALLAVSLMGTRTTADADCSRLFAAYLVPRRV